MNYHNPSLRSLKSAVNTIRQDEAKAKQRLIEKIKEFNADKKSEDFILTYMLKNTRLDLENAKRFLKYNF